MPKSVKVFAPATVANVAAGFDILGFAVHQPGDEVTVTLSDRPGVRILSMEGDGGRLPLDPGLNTATVPILGLLSHLRFPGGIEVEIKKMMPLGSGLGSSAASAVAGAFAANELLGRPLSREALLPFALEGERVACGSAHADNAGPALLGGFVLVRSYDPLDVVRIPTPAELICTLVHPSVEVRTEDARRILRSRIRLSDAVVQWGNTAGLVAGLVMGDYELIGRSIRDVIVEPVRSILVPGFDKAKAAALESGALGCSISGSGPSIFALSRGREIAGRVADAMSAVYGDLGISVDTYISNINTDGPTVLESRDR
jgi:homoserine kinase